jgi:hypothetical protein
VRVARRRGQSEAHGASQQPALETVLGEDPPLIIAGSSPLTRPRGHVAIPTTPTGQL